MINTDYTIEILILICVIFIIFFASWLKWRNDKSKESNVMRSEHVQSSPELAKEESLSTSNTQQVTSPVTQKSISDHYNSHVRSYGSSLPDQSGCGLTNSCSNYQKEICPMGFGNRAMARTCTSYLPSSTDQSGCGLTASCSNYQKEICPMGLGDKAMARTCALYLQRDTSYAPYKFHVPNFGPTVVTGHWRTTKSGGRVWVKSHRRSK